MFLILWLLIKASDFKPFAVFFLDHVVFFAVLLFILLVILLVSCFLVFTNSKMQYFEEIHRTLESISKGNLDVRIPVKSTDELSQLALTVNDMAYKLKLLIEEEKYWEKTKNDLVTNVSHDLRTPLTSILGYMELIVKEKYEDEETLKHYADVAYSKCKSLKALVDDLFEYSKLNSTEIKVNKMRVNLAELLEQVILGFLPVLGDVGMEYRLSFPNEKISVNGDPVLLARMFDNLINNAINYGKEGKYLDVELQQENNDAIVRIINYGNPILKEDLPLIFERFYKVDKSRSQYKNGSGIGLAIVKSIVDLHQGTVEADSENNKTIFEVRLPLDEPKAI
jgi:signal transduction histidine kinase